MIIGKKKTATKWHLVREPTTELTNEKMPLCSSFWGITQFTTGLPTCLKCLKYLKEGIPPHRKLI